MTFHGNSGAVITSKRCASISGEDDIAGVRALARRMLERFGLMDEVFEAQILTIIDELAKNILRHGGAGMICVEGVRQKDHTGFRITAEDSGRGIPDLDLAFSPGYSEDSGMGMGLNLLKALSDDIRVANLLSGGALIEVWKWT